MKKANWKDVAELIGIASIVASLIFVGLEMRQAQQIALADGQITAASATMSYEAIILNHPDIWTRGKSGEVLNPGESAIFENLVIATNDMAFARMAFSGLLSEDLDVEFAVHDFAAFLFENPGARTVWIAREAKLDKYRKFLSSRGNIYSHWREAVHVDLAKLDKIYASFKGEKIPE
jgi:hypothetical protein